MLRICNFFLFYTLSSLHVIFVIARNNDIIFSNNYFLNIRTRSAFANADADLKRTMRISADTDIHTISAIYSFICLLLLEQENACQIFCYRSILQCVSNYSICTRAVC